MFSYSHAQLFLDHSTSDDDEDEVEDNLEALGVARENTEESQDRRSGETPQAIPSVDIVSNDIVSLTLGLSDTSSNGSLAPLAVARSAVSDPHQKKSGGTPPLLPRGSSQLVNPPTRPLPSSPSHQLHSTR